MNKQRKLLRFFSSVSAVIILAFGFSACGGNSGTTEKNALKDVSITLLDGEHYSVIGDNKKLVTRGDSVTYNIEVDKGYEIVSSFGKDCEIVSFKENPSFKRQIVFSDLNYNTTVTLSVKQIEIADFSVSSNIDECTVEVDSAAGRPDDENGVYDGDMISVYAIPSEGYRFQCWSTGNYLSAGGKYLSNDKILNEFDYSAASELYANFKSTANTARTIIYDFGSGVEIEQDCSPMVAHHPRANTLTEPDLAEYGFNLPEDKMLVGWNTEDGEYVGLGSRTEVSEETYINLYPVWKEYSPESDFVFDDGKITKYTGNETEVVIPAKIDGEDVTEIASNAFEDCMAEVYYIPNSVTGIEKNAFLNCKSLIKFYMSDNIMEISDESFTGCENFTTLYLNAYLKPRYINNWRAYKSDFYDKLSLHKNNGKRKLVIFGGSSVRYGYNSDVCCDIIEDVEVYNLGNDWTACPFAQFELLKNNLHKDDIFLHAPEIASWAWFGLSSLSRLTAKEGVKLNNIYIYILAESNIGSISNLTVSNYSDMFNMLSLFNEYRVNMPDLSYVDSFETVENGFGHYTRGQTVIAENGIENYCFNSPSNLNFNISSTDIIYTDNKMYSLLSKKGIKVVVTFSSINYSNLLLTYQTEDNVIKSANDYTQLVKDNIYNAKIILSQSNTIYNGKHFADSDFHLGFPFCDEHTTKVMNALVEALGL